MLLLQQINNFHYIGIHYLFQVKFIVRTRLDPQPKWFEQWPNKPRTMNLLESRPVTECSMS